MPSTALRQHEGRDNDDETKGKEPCGAHGQNQQSKGSQEGDAGDGGGNDHDDYAAAENDVSAQDDTGETYSSILRRMVRTPCLLLCARM